MGGLCVERQTADPVKVRRRGRRETKRASMSGSNLAPPRAIPSPKTVKPDKPLEEFPLTHDPLTGLPIDDEDAPL